MLVPLLTNLRGSQAGHGIAMERFYAYVGMSRQGYFQALARHHREEAMMVRIKEEVLSHRGKKDRRAGSRTLYYNLDIKQAYGLGVNKFERLLSRHGLSLKPLRIRVVTTESSVQSWNYADLSKGLKVTGINQLVVGDLTYVSHGRHRYYLFCLTDVYSARIVGWHLSTRMRAQEALQALTMWKRLRGRGKIAGCIHHTDGGSQYFSELYLGAMASCRLQVSVARSCLDNGFAEQRNGLLKHHLMPLLSPDLQEEALYKAVGRLIHGYNHERKQQNLGWRSPVAYENHWALRDDRPVMQVYDRDKGDKTDRNGF